MSFTSMPVQCCEDLGGFALPLCSLSRYGKHFLNSKQTAPWPDRSFGGLSSDPIAEGTNDDIPCTLQTEELL